MMGMYFSMRLDGWMKPSHCVELTQAAEERGFDNVWFAENPYGRGVFSAMVASGLATSRIGIGVGVLNPFQRHPSLIAMEMGAMDELLGGRTKLGIGSGVTPKLKQTEMNVAKPIGALRDAILIIRDLMTTRRSDHKGSVFSASGLTLEFEPIRPDYPIYMAAMGDQSIRLAGQVADGLMISNFCTPGFTKRALDMIAADRGENERRLRNVVQYAPCFVGSDRRAVRDGAKDLIGRMFKEGFGPMSSPTSRNWHLIGSDSSEQEFLDIASKLQAGAAGRDVLSDRILDLYAVAGDGDDCTAAFERYRDAGVTEVVVTFRGSDPLLDMTLLADVLRNLR